MYEKIGLLVSGLALILNIVGVSIPYWFYFGTTRGIQGTSINFGLWRGCVHGSVSFDGPVITMCNTYENTGYSLPSEFKAARALEILAILATAAVVIIVCLKIFVSKDDKRLLYVAPPISVIAGLLVLIGAIIFVADNDMKKVLDLQNKVEMKPNAAFGLCIVSGVLSFVSAVLYLLGARTITGFR